MANIAELLGKTKEQEVFRIIEGSVFDFPVIVVDKIKFPVVFTTNSWMCRETKYTFCKRPKQTPAEKPDCENCVLRIGGI